MAKAQAQVLTQEVIADLSDEELMQRWTELGEQQEVTKAQLLLFSHEHQRREEQARIAQRLGTLNDEERSALLQYIESQGTESGAAVSQPGRKDN